jgi:hypothetical protein
MVTAVDPAEKKRQALRAQADDIADQQNEYGSGRPDGSKRRPRRPSGNARQAILRRLRNHHPELHRLVLSGEITPFRAAVTAGFRRAPGRRPRRLTVPLELELSPDQMMELWLGPGQGGSLFADADELKAA